MVEILGNLCLGFPPQTVPICESELLVALGISDLEHWVSHTHGLKCQLCCTETPCPLGLTVQLQCAAETINLMCIFW